MQGSGGPGGGGVRGSGEERRGEGRVRARASERAGRSPRPGFGDTVGTSSGGGRGGVPCGGWARRPAGAPPSHGPVAPGPACCGRPRAESVSVGVGGGGERGALRLPLPGLARLPPLQVPSASRRGGLKTHGGVARPPWGRGGRARGESGGPSLLPQTPLPPPPPPRGRGAARRATPALPAAAAVGRGLPGGRGAGPGPVCPRACAPRVPDGGGCVCAQVGTPRAPVGCPSPPRLAGRCRAPRRETFRPRSGLLFSVSSDLAGQRQPSLRGGNVPCHRRGTPPKPRETKLVRLLAVDHSARASMKNAASCEN